MLRLIYDILKISGHDLVTVLTDHGLPSKGKKAETEVPKIVSYNFAKADIDQFKGALQSVQWAKVVCKENSSLQEKTKYFFDAVCEAAEKSDVPLKTSRCPYRAFGRHLRVQ
jgi:hypothetical protein